MNKRYIDFVPVQTAPKKSSKIVSSTRVKPVENISARSTTVAKPAAAPARPVAPAKPVAIVSPAPSVFKAPTPRFINTEKIDKRPLSDSVAPKRPTILAPEPIISSSSKKTKKVKAPKKSKKTEAPVEIIDAPKKKSVLGTIIAIIITIILGAAAGAAAFLLLPK